MNQLQHIAKDPGHPGVIVRIGLIEDARLTAKDARTATYENDRRATEVGPVLEEILRGHWEHWGLNE